MGGPISGSVLSTSSKDLNIASRPARVSNRVIVSVDSGRRECNRSGRTGFSNLRVNAWVTCREG